MIKYVGRPT